MPDLTIEIVQVCQQQKVGNIGGYRQDYDPLFGHSCTCAGFKYRKTCKHIRQFMVKQCRWNGMYDEPQTPEQEANRVCPWCGGPTEFVKVAV